MMRYDVHVTCLAIDINILLQKERAESVKLIEASVERENERLKVTVQESQVSNILPVRCITDAMFLKLTLVKIVCAL